MSFLRMSRKPVIGLDLDECLGEFNKTIAQFYNLLHGTHLTIQDFHSFKYWEVWGGTAEETSQIVKQFFKHPLFTNGIPVVPGAKEALTILHEKFDIYIVTSRHKEIEDITRQWIQTHFDGLIKDILIGNFWNAEGIRLSKQEMLEKIHADVFIDDNYNYVRDCKDHVRIPILFGSYGWNARSDPSDYDGMYHLDHWSDFCLFTNYMNLGKVFLSSGCAFLMAILVALLIETFGGAVGSIIGTVPSTIIPSAYILLTETRNSVEVRTNSMLACIFGMFATDVLFMPTWKVVPQKLPKKWSNGMKIFVTTAIGILLWFIGALLTTYVQELMTSIGVSMWAFGIAVIVITAAFGIWLCWSLPPTPAGKNKVSIPTHLSRGVAAAVFVFISGVLSQSGAGKIAGLMTTFPAIFATTMVSVSLAQGAEVSTGAIGPLIMGGMSVGFFSIGAAFAFSVLKLHAGWCLVIAFFFAVLCWSIPVYFFVKWRRDATTKKTRRMVEEAETENEIEMKTKELETNSGADVVPTVEVVSESKEDVQGDSQPISEVTQSEESSVSISIPTSNSSI